MKLPVGRRFNGPVTPEGNVPKYTDNAFASLCNHYCYIYCWRGNGMVERFDFNYKLGTNVISNEYLCFIFAFFLTLKGLYFPSTTDCGTTGNFIVDFYWGTELYQESLVGM